MAFLVPSADYCLGIITYLSRKCPPPSTANQADFHKVSCTFTFMYPHPVRILFKKTFVAAAQLVASICLLVQVGTSMAIAQSGSNTANEQGLAYGNALHSLDQASTAVRIDSAIEFYNRYIKHQDSTSAQQALDYLLNTARERSYKDLICCAYGFMGDKWARYKSPNTKSDRFHAEGIRLANTYNLPEVNAYLRYKWGLYLYNSKLIPEAVVEMLNARDQSLKIGQDRIPFHGEQLYHLGRALYDLEDLERAYDILKEAQRYPFKRSYYQLQAINTLAIIAAREQDFRMARRYAMQALATDEARNNAFWYTLLHKNMGSYFVSDGLLDSARRHIRIAEQYLPLASASLPEMVGLKAEVALVALACEWRMPHQDIRQTVKPYLDSLKALLPFMSELVSKRNYFAELGRYETAIGNHRAAAAAHDMASRLTDSMAIAYKQGQIKNIAIRIEAERKLVQLNEQVEAQQAAEKLQTMTTAGILVVVLLVAALLFTQLRKRQAEVNYQRQLITSAQQAEELARTKAQQAESELSLARQKLDDYAREMKRKSQLASQLTKTVEALPQQDNNLTLVNELRESILLTNDDWDDFRNTFGKVYGDFLFKLKEQLPNLSPADLRIICLMKLGLDTRQMSHALGITMEGVKKARHRLRQKLTQFDASLTLEEILGDM